MRCPHCGRQVRAALRDGKYVCPECEREIGGRQASGVISSAQPAASRSGESEPRPRMRPAGPATPDRPATRSPRRRDRSASQLLGVLLSVFIVATFILSALLIRSRYAGDEPQPEPTPGQGGQEAAAADARLYEDVMAWVNSEPEDYKRHFDKYREAAEQIEDPRRKLKATTALGDLKAEAEQAEAHERLRREIERLGLELAQARDKIARLEKQLEADEQQVAVAQPRTASDVAEKPAPIPPDAPDDTARTAYETALADARQLVADRKYGRAMKAMEAVVADYPGTEWATRAETERRRIRKDAYDALNKLRERADELVRVKDYAGARQLYAEALLFDVPEVRQIVDQQLARIRRLADASGAEATAPDRSPAAVRKLLDALESDSEFVRSNAARRLGDLGDPAAVPQLISALDDEKWYVRASAAASLGKLGDGRAIPGLIEALDDKWEAVVYDVHQALKALTKQEFSPREAAKWRQWYEQNKGTLPAPPKPKAPEAPASFGSVILERGYDPDTVRFVIPEGSTLPVGSTVRLARDGKRLCQVSVVQTSKDDAFGKMLRVQAGAELSVGDPVTVVRSPAP
jgi:TolA-binding protein